MMFRSYFLPIPIDRFLLPFTQLFWLNFVRQSLTVQYFCKIPCTVPFIPFFYILVSSIFKPFFQCHITSFV